MVNKKLLIHTALLLVTVLSVAPIVLDSIVVNADIEYHLNQEYAKIWRARAKSACALLGKAQFAAQ